MNIRLQLRSLYIHAQEDRCTQSGRCRRRYVSHGIVLGPTLAETMLKLALEGNMTLRQTKSREKE
jgi:hypothetical protein